jgi:PKHD-type hydroxylase
MNLHHQYWYFPKAVPDRICDEIKKYAISIKDQLALTGKYGKLKNLDHKHVKDLKKKRDSDIVWLNERWIYKEIHPYVHQANRNADWNFQWDHSENCQFTKYQKGQYYDWHCDGWGGVYNKPNTPSHGKIRKISVTLSLCDGKEYKGGDFEVDFKNNSSDEKPNTKVVKEIRPKGSLIVFPSDLWHRVKPITKGIRYSLVIWNLGWPFK